MSLHALANPPEKPGKGEDGTRGISANEDVGVWVKRGREWEWEKWKRGKVAEVYMDVGLMGKPHQVSLSKSK